ncbi:type VI secretion system Vgr family protein [Vibrio tapetis]|uniref:VgrG protein n=1 Tax=Vibrio tapetis subsp. tapetis TaxID=1671868 RepID=A0A2N8ZJY3_9VIBR|nr:type VI secretion system tip protein TssI/VgrG [Vibrio tapetis]SON52186.1 VgrG protein [Vibrio tapetis subsp. tapetis]
MPNSEIKNETRPLTAKLSDGKTYIVTHLECEERLSHGVTMSFTIASNKQISSKPLGKPLCIRYKQASETRQFLGLVSSIELMSHSEEKSLYFYQVQAVDPLSLLAYRHNRQIFQNLTTKQIIEKVIGDSDFKSYFKFSISGNGQKHEYCVQLDESDLAFMQRLLSAEGWHYHVEHSDSKPIVTIADSNQSFKAIERSTIAFQNGLPDPERVLNHWQHKAQITTSKLCLADHSQELAEVFDSGERKSAADDTIKSLEDYRYGQGFGDKSVIRKAAKIQMEAHDALQSIATSQSSISALACGKRFKLSDHPVSSFNQDYFIIKIVHSVTCDESGQQTHYNNHFQAVSYATPFRPGVIDKPHANGIHTATVTGPNGEEIYRDKVGRIKVHFHWDRDGKPDENCSCWLPVSQGAASKGFGMQFIPRIGDEVLVQYIDANPDRPIVVGSIYNKANSTPYSSATQAGIKTRSTPKGSSKQGNELRFEDQKDKEQVFLHAEKDWLLDVNNDSTSTIKGKALTQVEKTLDVSSKEAFTVKSEKTLTTNAKDDLSAASDKNINLDAGSNASVTAKSAVKVDGSSISITGKSKIELKVGASKIEISASGIKIDAPQVSISGKAKAEMKAAMVTVEGQGKADVKAAMVSINGSAMTQVKAGAMVQIQGAIAKVN